MRKLGKYVEEEKMSPIETIAKNRLTANEIEQEHFIPIAIANLTGEDKQYFYIPSYQRGYRWDLEQIDDLLDDLYEFINNEDEHIYWLQPIVLMKKSFKININEQEVIGWEVVDGQQRLTSLLLILSYLSTNNSQLYSIKYETRPQIFFDDIEKIDPDSDIDSNYIFQNYERIKNWFAEKKDIENKFKSILLEKDMQKTTKIAAFIVYVLHDKNEGKEIKTNELVKKFNNLNNNQIKLSGSDLLKAFFVLSYKENKYNVSEFISEWNQIEYTLQDDEYWSFLSNDMDASTRIDLLFDIYTNKRDNELQKDYSYKIIKNKIENNKNLDLSLIWNEIKEISETLILCYKNKTIRHYVGFLIAVGKKNWHNIRNDLRNTKKSEIEKTFQKYICEFLRKCEKNKQSIVTEDNTIDEDVILKLDYESDKDEIRALLLLHNVMFCVKSDTMSFSFKKYKDKKNKCDIEHIDPHTENDFSKLEDAVIYINGMSEASLNYLWSNNKDEKDDMKVSLCDLQEKTKYIKQAKESEKSKFREEFKLFIEKYKIERNKYQKNNGEDDVEYSKNSIANLVLLNYDINREYKNRPFPDKHETVLKNELEGRFIPPCTKLAFAKKYTKDFAASTDPDWNYQDKKSYFEDICICFNNILSKGKKDAQ